MVVAGLCVTQKLVEFTSNTSYWTACKAFLAGYYKVGCGGHYSPRGTLFTGEYGNVWGT